MQARQRQVEQEYVATIRAMPDPAVPYSLDNAWLQIRQMVQEPVRSQVQALVRRNAQALSDIFYDRMLSDPAMLRYLDHEIVNRRLHASMVRWLDLLFDPQVPIPDLLEMQRRTGEVHARIGISHAAVARGARELKRAIGQQLLAAPEPGDPVAQAVQYVYEMIDLAMDCMGESAASNATRLLRSEESYRMFFLTQDLRAERERQKSQLLEWAHQMLVRNFWEVVREEPGAADAQGPVSQFKLWVEHKASMMFEGVPELALLRECIERTESGLLPRLRAASTDHAQAKTVVSELHACVERMKELLGAMFDRLSALEDGRDSLTRLLNRRYLPSIVRREIDLAQARGQGFALLAIGIDGFADLRLGLGDDATDSLVTQVAERLSESVRASDFAFRTGDSQFLVLIVEADGPIARRVADALRERIAQLRVRSVGAWAPDVTVSIGGALFDGHPDYHRLLERAELALHDAQKAGANRILLAPETPR